MLHFSYYLIATHICYSFDIIDAVYFKLLTDL